MINKKLNSLFPNQDPNNVSNDIADHKDGPVWYWQDDAGIYQPYKKHINTEIEKAFQNKEDSVQYNIGYRAYKLTFSDSIQRDVKKANHMRSVKRKDTAIEISTPVITSNLKNEKLKLEEQLKAAEVRIIQLTGQDLKGLDTSQLSCLELELEKALVKVKEAKKASEKTESLVCKICEEFQINVVFIPCGHLCCCETCGNKVQLCPVCRSEITKRQKTFLV